MPLDFNIPAMVATAAGVASGVGLGCLTHMRMLSFAVGCLVAAAVDVYYRLHSYEHNRWIDPESGASITMVPVYMFSAVVFVVGVLMNMGIL